MKIRYDFVTNSSSSSFVVALNVFDEAGNAVEVFRTDEGFDSERFYKTKYLCGMSDESCCFDEEDDEYCDAEEVYKKCADYSTFTLKELLMDALRSNRKDIPDILIEIFEFLEKKGMKKDKITKLIVSEIHNSSGDSISAYPDDFVDWERYKNSDKSMEEIAKLCSTDVESLNVYFNSFPNVMERFTAESVNSSREVVWYRFSQYGCDESSTKEIFERATALESLDTPTFSIARKYAQYGNVSDLEYVDDVVVGCKGQIKTVVVPEGVREISAAAFQGSGYNLIKVIISDGVRIIGDNAFKRCDMISEVVLPTSLEHIGAGAFENVDAFTMEGEGKRYYIKFNSIIDRETKTLVAASSKTVIPSDGSVTNIAPKAFVNNRSMRFVTVPEGVECIGDSAFAENCLRAISLPLSLKKIEGIETLSSRFSYANHRLKTYYAGSQSDWDKIKKDSKINKKLDLVFEKKG